MPSSFDLYVRGTSRLHRLDPRTKMAFVAVSFVLLLLTGRIPVVVGYLAVVHVGLLRAKVPRERIYWLWRQMLPLTALILVLWPLSNPAGGPALAEWWRIRITVPGVRQGALAALRVNGLAFAVYVLLLSTDHTRLLQGFVRLGLPFEWGLALAIGLRSLPLLHGTYGQITDAQRARGWTPEREGLFRRLQGYGPTLVALVIGALRLADAMTLALAARGFRPGQPRTTRCPLRMSRADRVCLVGLGLVTASVVLFEVGWL